MVKRLNHRGTEAQRKDMIYMSDWIPAFAG